MLGQNLKENHRIKFELVIEQVNITCTDINKTSDINNICLQLFYHGSSGKEAIETECITSSKRVSLTGLQYVLTWKHHQILKFSVTLSKRKGTYDKAKKPPELFLSQVDPYRNNPEKLGSAKLDVHEHANKKVTGQTYEHDDKISINLRNNKKILSCELMVKYRIPDTDPSVIDTSSIHSSVMTPSVSIETINSLDTRAFSHRTLETPIYKLLNEIHLIGLDGNLYSAEWSKMRLIFFVFGTMPDFMRNLKDLIQTLQADRTIGLYVEVVHICQGDLSERDVRYPYLPRSDYQNPTFHHIFNIQEPHPDHPKICVVNEKMTEYYVVEAYQIEKYAEERNPLELYYLWNNKKPPLDLKPKRSVSLHDDIPRQQQRMVPKSSSLVNIHGNNNHYRSSSYDGSSPSSRSSIKEEDVFPAVPSPSKPPRPPPLAIASKVIFGGSIRRGSEDTADLNMYNILVENIHSRIINFMMDLLTAGKYVVPQEDKENICETASLVLSAIESCVTSRSQNSSQHNSLEELAPPKPSRSYASDRKRKISKLHAKERENNPMVDVVMYQRLIANIHNQLLELIRYLYSDDRKGIPDIDKQAMVERIQLIDTIAESCKAISSESDVSSSDDEDFLNLEVFNNSIPRPRLVKDVSFDVPESIAINYRDSNSSENSKQFGRIDENDQENYVTDEHPYDTLENIQNFSFNENSKQSSLDHSKDESGDTKIYSGTGEANPADISVIDSQSVTCNGNCTYPCDCTYSTVQKEDPLSSYLDYHIDVGENNEESDEIDAGYGTVNGFENGDVNESSLKRTKTVHKSVRYSAETLDHDLMVTSRKSSTRDGDVSAAQSFNDLSEMDRASSYYSSTNSLTAFSVREKIRLYTALQASESGCIEHENGKKYTKKSLKKWLSKSTQSLKKDKKKEKDGSNSSLAALKKFPPKPGVSVRKLSTGVDMRKTGNGKGTDKKETKQLKIRLKTMSKSVKNLERREEQALLELDEWKSRFDGVYSKMMQDSLNSSDAVKVTESLEYKTLEAELSSTTDSLNQLRETLQNIQMEMTSKQQHNSLLQGELERIRMMEHESQKVLEKCQKENIFFRHQVMLRGNLALRSGTFNLFKTRWFQLESMSSHTISPVISFYSGPDRLGQIVLAEVVTYEVVTDTQFRLSTRFATYVLNAENGDEAQKWLSGIENLKHTFLSDFSNGDG